MLNKTIFCFLSIYDSIFAGMNLAKPKFEKIEPNYGSSFTVRTFDDPCSRGSKFWHFHPEIEMVYIPKGNGKRHIGNHLSYFNDGDLVLIGSNLPHAGFTDRLSGNQKETVIQFLPEVLGSFYHHLPEFTEVKQMMETAKLGITYKGATRKKVGAKITKLLSLEPFERLLMLINILNDLAESDDYEILNVEKVILETSPQDNDRIRTIYHYVAENFQNQITLEEISSEVNLTPPSFSRYFKKQTGKTFTQFVNEVRLVHASKLLAEKPIPISEVCFESGFNNFSHFTKQFKKFSGQSPSDYRNELKKMIGPEIEQ